MFDKKETKNIYVDKEAAKKIAKSNVKAAKEAARIQADAEESAAYHERMARKEAEEMQFARENPEAYLKLKEAERQSQNEFTKAVGKFFFTVILIGLSVFGLHVTKCGDTGIGYSIMIVAVATLILTWYPTIKRHLKS